MTARHVRSTVIAVPSSRFSPPSSWRCRARRRPRPRHHSRTWPTSTSCRPTCHRRPGRPHDVPAGGAVDRRAVDLRRQPADGHYSRVGGGSYDAGDGHLGAGRLQPGRHHPRRGRLLAALEADRRAESRQRAYELLRGVTYLQTATGPNAGNPVLWMQPDGTLHASVPRTARPVRQRAVLLAGSYHLGARRGLRRVPAGGDPCSRPSCGPARPGGRGAAAPGARALRAHDGRRARPRRGSWSTGPTRAPKRCSGSRHTSGRAARRRRAPRCASSPRASPRCRPATRAAGLRRRAAVGAVAQRLARLGLADAGRTGQGLDGARRHLVRPGCGAGLRHVRPVAADVRRSGQRPAADAAGHHPDRVRRRLAAAVAARDRRRDGLAGAARLAGMVAAWYFGANASGQPAYDPATGRTIDGIAPTAT